MTADSTHEDIAALLQPLPLPPIEREPLVSVLIPCYNYGRYVEQAIASVQSQSYRRFEIIVCDDGSTDDSWQVIRCCAAADPRITAIHQANAGQGAALNRCYAASSGAVICLLDADDYYAPNKLAAVVAALDETPAHGFLGHPIALVNPAGRVVAMKPMSGRSPHGWFGPTLVKRSGMLGDIAPSSAMCLRREIANNLFPIPEDTFRRNGEGYLLLLAPFITRAYGMSETLAFQRIHGDNMTTGAEVDAPAISATLREGEFLWRLQRAFLERLNPALPRHLGAWDETVAFRLYRLMQAKFEDSPTFDSDRAALLKHPDFKTLAPHRRIFWRIAPRLPHPWFTWLVGIYFRPNFLKGFVSRLHRGGRASRSRCATPAGTGRECDAA